MPRGRPSHLLSLRELALSARAAGSPHLSRVSDLAVFTAWREAAGPLARNVTRPVSLGRGILTVEVFDAGWLRELRTLAAEITANLSALLGPGRVIEIRFLARRRTATAPPREAPSRPALPAAAPAAPPAIGTAREASLETVLAGIRDEKLRLRLTATARRYLHRRA